MAMLRMFASGPADMPLPPDAADRVARATGAILAEARAAGRTAVAGITETRFRSGHMSLLTARQARLEHAAEDAVASAHEAAADGNVAALRQRLRRFEVLTSAMWTIQLSAREEAAVADESLTCLMIAARRGAAAR